MAAARRCPSCQSRISRAIFSNSHRLQRETASPFFSFVQVRGAVHSANAAKYKRKDQPGAAKKKAKSAYDYPDLKGALQFPLVDAMRYLKAAEVGRIPSSAKYELHVRLRTPKNGAVVRNRMRLPHPVRTDLRICVICPPDSQQAKVAKDAGAAVVGEEDVFNQVKEGKIDFDRCICHTDSVQKLAKSGIARILGPRGLMPSAKTATVVKDVATTVRDMVGGTEYRERAGVVRMAIGQLAYTPEQLAKNIHTFIEAMNKDIAQVSDRTPKSIYEVVLSSTHGPGLSLTGDLRGPSSISNKDLTVN